MAKTDKPKAKAKKPAITGRGALRALAVLGAFAGAAALTASIAPGCSGWDPREPFTRNAPEVERARKELDAGQLETAEEALERYLDTGACADGGIGLPDSVRQKSGGSFDLGLTLFYLAERFGQRFGDEDLSDGGAEAEAARRSAEIDCALVVVKAIASDPKVPTELRARAFYLAGNLEFLRKKYEDAVKLYDQSLALVPGVHEEAGGDGIGRDAAWNRAIALRRIEDEKDAGQDAADGSDGADGDDGSDGADGNDGSDGSDAADGSDAPDADDGNDGSDGDKPDGGKPDAAGEDAGDKGDAPSDAPGDANPKDSGEDGPMPQPDKKGEPQPASPQPHQEDRILDELEEAPTYQEQEAKQRAGQRRGGKGMEDK